MEIVTGLRKTPHISSNDMQSFQLGITGEDGAFPVGEIFRTELASNNELKVYDGEGVVGGVHFRVAPGTYDSITLENGSQGKRRKDLIVVRYTRSASDGTENTEWAVKKGTETTGTPTAPAATTGDIRNGDALAELPMFEIEYNGLNVVEVTEKFQTLMSLKELRELVSSLNSNMEILCSRELGSAGRALKIYDVSSENLKYGCFGEGIYIYPAYYGTEKGAPDDWGGYMISVGIGGGSSKKHLKYAYTLGGSVYFMRQAAETGTVEQDWTKVSVI